MGAKIAIYETPETAAKSPPEGWAKLPGGPWVPRRPYIDTKYPGLRARLDRNSCRAVAARDRVRLISPETICNLNLHGHRIEPCILPDAAQRAAMPRLPGELATAYQARIRRDMCSLDWCIRHDMAVTAELDADHWDQITPVMNDGKYWTEGGIFGWSKRGGFLQIADQNEWWQPLQAAHLDGEHQDYSSTAMFECDEEPTWLYTADETTADATTPLEKALAEIGTREATGRNDGEQIARFFASAARRGADGVERATGWRSGWEWCAAFFGWCGWRTHRIAVHEYVTDAREQGLWIPKDRVQTISLESPEPGWGCVLARDGQEPEHGGSGHICRVIDFDRFNGVFYTVGGNEENRVKKTRRHISDQDLRGFLRP